MYFNVLHLLFSCKGLDYEFDDMEESIKYVQSLCFFSESKLLIIEALMMVIFIDV